MRIKTLTKYINILKSVKNSGLSIKEYCNKNNLSEQSIYNAVYSLKQQNEEESELVSELLSLYEEVTKVRYYVNNENAINDDNKSNVTYIRNESNQIEKYLIEVYRKDQTPFKTVLSREDVETIFGMYTYYGGNITARNVANEFPKYTVPEIKYIFRAFMLTKDSSWAAPHLIEELNPAQLSQYRMNLKERAAFKYADATQEREFKNTLNKLASKVKQLEDRNEFFKNLATSSYTIESKIFEKDKTKPTGVLLLSDIHVGAFNTPNGYLSLDEYSENEINRRLDKIAEEICKKDWDSLLVMNLGDSVDSYKGTTAKGTPLPTTMSDKEMSKMYMRVMLRFFKTLKNRFENVCYVCTGDSNHDSTIGWLNNVALSFQLEQMNVMCHISDDPIDIINIDNYSIIYMHGHDSKTQFKGFPLHLDEKTKNWFNNYFLQSGFEFKQNKIVVKGDLHQFAVDSCATFDYINAPSVYGSSSWIVSNFGKGKQGVIYLEINKNSNYNIGSIWV